MILGLLGLDILGNFKLQGVINAVIIAAHLIVVEVEILRDEHAATAGHFQDGQADDFIVGGGQPVTLIVLQVCLLDLEVKAGLEGSQMGNLQIDIPIPVAALLFVRIVLRPTSNHPLVPHVVLYMVRVDNTSLLFVVDMVEDFEDVFSNQLIVSVDQHDDGVSCAVLRDCLVDVGQGSHAFLIGKHNDVEGDVVVFDPLLDELISVVS